MKPCTKLLLMAALTLMIPAFGGRYDVHARILHRGEFELVTEVLIRGLVDMAKFQMQSMLPSANIENWSTNATAKLYPGCVNSDGWCGLIL